VLAKLPGWVVADETSVREEVAEWADLSPPELWRLAKLCSRDVMWAVRASDDPGAIHQRVDPLPASAVAALERLRREMRRSRGPG
jgi:hypothetical protein